jgi:hypothetical protein
MKKSSILLILGIIVVFTTVFFIFLKNDQHDSEYFKQVSFKNKNTITNSTDRFYIDTIVRVALDILNLENEHVIIMNLDKSMESALGKDIQMKAHVKQYDNKYVIFLSEVSRADAIATLCHECIHIRQYSNRKLIVLQDLVFWNDVLMYPRDIPYEDRPWEIEAFQMENELIESVLDTVY